MHALKSAYAQGWVRANCEIVFLDYKIIIFLLTHGITSVSYLSVFQIKNVKYLKLKSYQVLKYTRYMTRVMQGHLFCIKNIKKNKNLN